MLFAASALAAAVFGAGDRMTTYDGKHDIRRINVTAVYFVPAGREPLPDWKDRVTYYTRRIEQFHKRELDGRSDLRVTVRPDPVRSELRPEDFRKGDGDVTFFRTMDEARALAGWKPDHKDGFPILLVFSDINWRELDDFRRVRVIDGKPQHEGSVDGEGRHHPGAESGGARATYNAKAGFGLGLVSGDGWRVPYAGSDCVVYHEGVGHPIGLPHPDPIDDTVMGTGQYHFWINQAKLNDGQKRKLGWAPPAGKLPAANDLFTRFTAITRMPVPAPGESVELDLTWPDGAKVRSLTVRAQTDLTGPWVTLPSVVVDGGTTPPKRVNIGSFDRPTPVSYRVDAVLEDGQAAEVWGYFQVKARK